MQKNINKCKAFLCEGSLLHSTGNTVVKQLCQQSSFAVVLSVPFGVLCLTECTITVTKETGGQELAEGEE
jgi:hypothetical protein